MRRDEVPLVAQTLSLMPHTFPNIGNPAEVVGQPILAAAGFQPAFAGSGTRTGFESRLKGGCGQNCPPHN
jgi:hypothetical protein